MKKSVVILIAIMSIICAFQYYKVSSTPMDLSMLVGQWFSYQDCPTTIYTFSEDKKLNVMNCDGDYETISDHTTTYEIAGNRAEAIIDNEKYEFTFEDIEQEQKLKVNKGTDFWFLDKKK
jgi:hypothetical protein